MKILLVDDNVSLVKGLNILMQKLGHIVDCVFDVEQAMKMIKESDYDLIITDLKLPDGQGTEIVKVARSKNNPPEVILMTAFGSVETAVEAMKLGAMDYLTKPVSTDDFKFRLKRVEHFRKLGKDNRILSHTKKMLLSESGLSDPLEDICGNSDGIKNVKKMIEKVASYPSTVLIQGETGVGKELVAKAVHLLSERSSGPFVRVNCAAIAASLFESELFGHEKGAFTDAHQRRIGRFEAAKNGTVFLDEVGELPLEMQPKLLRALQEKEIYPVGSSKPVKIDVRIIAATNRNLLEMSKSNSFRQDLFYRLSVFNIQVPPLRERKQDIKVLAEKLLKRIAEDFSKAELKITPDALEYLVQQDWPGNIRQLSNSLERAAVMTDSDLIQVKDFVEITVEKTDDYNTEGLVQALESLEVEMIKKAMEHNNYVKSRAAQQLKIPRTQLIYRLKKLNLE